MEALHLSAGRLTYHPDYPEPVPVAGEAVVAVELAGICGTDLELIRGYADFAGIPGHEFVGRVVSGSPQWLGKRVVADINIGCGECRRCLNGGHKHCARRRVIGLRDRPGGFAGRVSVPVDNLVAVPEKLDPETAVFAEPLAAALQVVPLLGQDPGLTLVIGAGCLGQLILRALGAAGIDSVAVCRHASQRRLAQASGADVVGESELEADSFDNVVEASGNPAGLALALNVVTPGGTVVVKSTCAEPGPVDTAALVVKEVRLLGSRCGAPAEAVRLLAQKRIDPAGLVDAVLPLARGPEAFERAGLPGAGKVLLRPTAKGMS